jgi:hypothetical protein
VREQLQIYNGMLRQHPPDRFQTFREGGNLFTTTIAVLASAVQKLARVAPIREGTRLYRGLNRLMELPEAFFRPDNRGRRGFAEWGFLSTTQDKEIALKYSLGQQGHSLPMIMVVESSAVDRGANVQELSQYPQVRRASVQVLTL